MTDKTTDKRTKSQEVAADAAALLRARNPLLWVVTREEARVEGYLVQAAASAGYAALTWDVAQGVAEVSPGREPDAALKDPGAVLDAIREAATDGKRGRRLWVMRDLPPWLTGSAAVATLRQLRNLVRLLPGTPRDRAQAVVVLSPSGDVPPELSAHAVVVEWPLPDREEVAAVLDAAVDALPEEMRGGAAPNGTREAAVDAALGLTGEEAAACYAKSLVTTRRVDPAAVAREKRRVVARERVLEWHDPLPGGLDAVGGLDMLKGWLRSRSVAYGPRARAYGLPAPKGCLIAGLPGNGKSLTAKAVATAWGVPLLRLDLGALKSKFVGESEGNLRRALRTIEAIGRCVVWVDEIEKALAGGTGGAADGGVSADALGALLSWMQERQGDAFVVATANDVTSLPPELIRKGRFDEVWWVDLPTIRERAAILQATLRFHNRDWMNVTAVKAIVEVASHLDGFTGAEVAALVPDALYAAFADGEREPTANDLMAAAATVVPLSRTADDKVRRLREWAKGRARLASTPEIMDKQATSTGRVVEMA